MNNIDIPPFYVGQEIVAIKDHPGLGLYKKGDEFIVNAIYKGCCEWMIDIGIPKMRLAKCFICNTIKEDDGFFGVRNFAPKHNLLGEFISMKEFADKQLEIVGAN